MACLASGYSMAVGMPNRRQPVTVIHSSVGTMLSTDPAAAGEVPIKTIEHDSSATD
jgi:hypothetical protein